MENVHTNYQILEQKNTFTNSKKAEIIQTLVNKYNVRKLKHGYKIILYLPIY